MTRIRDTSKTQRKIRHTGKTESLVDPIKVAKALGAESTMSGPKRSRDGRNYREVIRNVTISGRIKEKIYELNEKNLKKYTPLIETMGDDFFHCVYIAARNVKDFWKQVYGYRITTSNYLDYTFVVSFYKKK